MTDKARLGYAGPVLPRSVWRAELTQRPVEPELPYRHADPADCDALGELMLEAYRGTIDERYSKVQDTIAHVMRYFAGAFGNPILDCSFVVLDRERLVSTSLVTFDAGEPLLAQVYTAPAHQNRGLAGALIQLSMNALAADGYSTLSLIATVGNAPAEHLYSKLGFAPVEDV
ncbi:MAG: GNAT family N-acetyltransferase [Dehalococcoidia bacterium]